MKKLLILISIVFMAGMLVGCDDIVNDKTYGGPACLAHRVVQVDGKYYLACRSYGTYYVVGPEVKTTHPDIKFVPEKP